MTNNAEDQIIKIDDVEYKLDNLSDNAKAQLASIQFVDDPLADSGNSSANPLTRRTDSMAQSQSRRSVGLTHSQSQIEEDKKKASMSQLKQSHHSDRGLKRVSSKTRLAARQAQLDKLDEGYKSKSIELKSFKHITKGEI